MKNKFTIFSRVLLLFVLFFFYGSAVAQSVAKYTPYDDLPGVRKILKPDYQNDFPEWGKMLYQYPINYNKINDAFNEWEKEIKKANEAKGNEVAVEGEEAEEIAVEAPLVRFFKIWNRSVAEWAKPDGTITVPDMKEYNAKLMKTQQAVSSKVKRVPAAGNTSNWTFWGPKQTFWVGNGVQSPAPWQANVYSFDVTESHPNILFCGTETGYVNKSTDKGANWQITGQDYPFGGSITGILIHPTCPDTVFACAGGGIHKTINGGATWTRTSSSVQAERLRVDPNNSNKLVGSGWKGISITTDLGATWTLKTASGCTTDFWDVQFKPKSSDTIYALSKDAVKGTFRFVQSSDAGNTFGVVTNFPDSVVEASGGLLAVTPANPNVVYAFLLARNMNKRPFIYKGVQSGGVWKWSLQHTGSDEAFTGGSLNNGQGYYDIALAVSPLNENILFAGTCSLHRSADGGKTFTAMGGYAGSYAIHPDMQEMKIMANKDVWVATDGGVNYCPSYMTVTPQPKVNMLIGSDFWGFDQGWNEDICVGGRYHNGNTAITDFYNNKSLRLGGGESATGWVISGKSRCAVFDDLGGGVILPKDENSNTEGGFAFSKNPNMDGYGSRRSNVVAHPYYSGTIYVGNGNILWISKDYGQSFDQLYEFPDRVMYFNISMTDPNVMYVDVNANGFYRTTDGGVTFKRFSPPSGWAGRMSFVISLYNPMVIYAIMQDEITNVFRGRDYNGLMLWEKYSTDAKKHKWLAIQPTTDGKDLVYGLITKGSDIAGAAFKKDGDAAWTDFNTNFPAGLLINAAAPFYRDSKLRVAGNSGVWETPFAEPDYTPIIVPWVDRKVGYVNGNNSFQLDSHSILNQSGVTWNWVISPAPASISNANIRNPIATFNKTGKYDVTLNVTKNGQTYSKTVTGMIEILGSPVEDCNNPGELDKKQWKLISVDSYQPGNEGALAFDGNTGTIWHTQWSPSNAPLPHNIQIDLGTSYKLSKFVYTGRSDQSNGRIKDYELYISADKTNWGTAVAKGAFTDTSAPQNVTIPATVGRYMKLVATSEVKGNAWTSAAELSLIGCLYDATGVQEMVQNESLKAFPIPATSVINVALPFQNGYNEYVYSVFNAAGQVISEGTANDDQKQITINLQNYASGNYFVKLKDKKGIVYRVKFIKR